MRKRFWSRASPSLSCLSKAIRVVATLLGPTTRPSEGVMVLDGCLRLPRPLPERNALGNVRATDATVRFQLLLPPGPVRNKAASASPSPILDSSKSAVDTRRASIDVIPSNLALTKRCNPSSTSYLPVLTSFATSIGYSNVASLMDFSCSGYVSSSSVISSRTMRGVTVCSRLSCHKSTSRM